MIQTPTEKMLYDLIYNRVRLCRKCLHVVTVVGVSHNLPPEQPNLSITAFCPICKKATTDEGYDVYETTGVKYCPCCKDYTSMFYSFKEEPKEIRALYYTRCLHKVYERGEYPARFADQVIVEDVMNSWSKLKKCCE